jgi:hypothetical protein
MMANSVRQSCAINATSPRSDSAPSSIRDSSGGRGLAPVRPTIRDNALQIRPVTPRGPHQSEIDVEDTHGARVGDAKTNMADSLLIDINEL